MSPRVWSIHPGSVRTARRVSCRPNRSSSAAPTRSTTRAGSGACACRRFLAGTGPPARASTQSCSRAERRVPCRRRGRARSLTKYEPSRLVRHPPLIGTRTRPVHPDPRSPSAIAAGPRQTPGGMPVVATVRAGGAPRPRRPPPGGHRPGEQLGAQIVVRGVAPHPRPDPARPGGPAPHLPGPPPPRPGDQRPPDRTVCRCLLADVVEQRRRDPRGVARIGGAGPLDHRSDARPRRTRPIGRTEPFPDLQLGGFERPLDPCERRARRRRADEANRRTAPDEMRARRCITSGSSPSG